MNKDQAVYLEKAKSKFMFSDKAFRLPVTVAMMTFNDSLTITACLGRLLFQNFIGRVIIIDCGSKDGTYELLKTQVKNKLYDPMEIELIRENLSRKDKMTRRKYTREKLCAMTETDYIMFLSANILLPHNGINKMYQEMKADTELDMLGLKYATNTFHVQLGATLMKTSVAKKVDWNFSPNCPCRTVRDQLIMENCKMVNHETMVAQRISGMF